MRRIIGSLVFMCALSTLTWGQDLIGFVVNDKEEPLFGATIIWQGADFGTIADEDGSFELPKQEETANLLINYVGYDPIFIEVTPQEDTVWIMLEGIHELMEVEVAAKLRDNYVSTINPINIETISSNELRKAPCCNLAESFETNGAIDVAYADAITGAREIQMLGLRGTYTQLMVENRPAMAGLGSAFAMEYLPGTWLSSIQISKGTSTVQNGYQSITGQINSELVKPFQDDRLFVNAYGSTFGRGELNVHLNKELNDKWSTGVLLHGSMRHNELDNNNDGFYDTPQKDMLDGMVRLFYRGDVFRSQINVHAIRDRHVAGQIASKVNASQLYRIQQDHDRVEVFGKAGYLGFDDPGITLGFITNASWHKLNSFYGNQIHVGEQRNAYANFIYSREFSPQHSINFGASYLYDDYVEQLDDADFSRRESVPGAFAEYTLKSEGDKGFGMVAGMRVDYHNLFGWMYTPRINLKYNFDVQTIVRVSAGRGYRTANLIAENIGLLASSRAIVVEDQETPRQEDAWNFGLNFTKRFTLWGRASSLTLDAYRTEFNKQVIVDRELDAEQYRFYNLEGRSRANSLLVMLSQELFDGLEIKVAYKYNVVEMQFRDGFRTRPLLPRHRGLITLDYRTPNEKWMFNTHIKLVGEQRFPRNIGLPAELAVSHTGNAPAYALLNAQITYDFGRFELYMGGENLTNYTVDNPIIDPANPFGNYFDATQVFAPVTGTMGYFGIRFGIE